MAESLILTSWFYALGSTAKPLADGRLGKVLRYVVVGAGLATPQLLSALAEANSHQPSRRLLSRIASVATLLGGFALRYVVIQAGRDSADDPEATFRMTSG
jgi:formate-dependent nitrite reductase membrane component NrfD